MNKRFILLLALLLILTILLIFWLVPSLFLLKSGFISSSEYYGAVPLYPRGQDFFYKPSADILLEGLKYFLVATLFSLMVYVLIKWLKTR